MHDAFAYDGAGNLVAYSNANVSATLTYDALNRQTSETKDFGPFSG